MPKNIDTKWKEGKKRAHTYKLKEERLATFLHVLALFEHLHHHLRENVLCPLQSVPGWDDTRMEHAGARWMMPRASQAWSCCQLLGCCSWIPVPAPAWLLLGGDVPCSESRWWQLKAKYNSVEPTKNEQVETYVVQAGCRRRPSVGAVGHVSSQQGSKTESSSCKTQQTVS